MGGEQAGDEDDPFVGGGGSGKGENMRAGHVTNVDLEEGSEERRRRTLWGRRGKWYGVVEGEADAFNVCVGSIEEVVDGECIGFVNRFGPRYRLQHGAYDNVRIDYCEVEGWGVLGLKVPCGLLGEFLRGVVTMHNIFRLNRHSSSYLQGMSGPGRNIEVMGGVPSSNLFRCSRGRRSVRF